MVDQSEPSAEVGGGGSETMIEAPETAHHAHGHDGGHRWFDIVMAVAILLVSAGSLYVALHTGHTMEALVEENERLVRAQSTPILQYESGNVGDDGAPAQVFTIKNVGTGPARVSWFELEHGGKTYSGVAKFVLDTGINPITFIESSINQTVLAQGDKRNLLVWRNPSDAVGQSRWKQIDKARSEVKVRACYCSVFDECWLSNLEADLPKRVPSCERPVKAK
jgi:hypothetical protein